MSSIPISAMNSDDSVTEWVSRARTGDQVAIGNLCERYFERLANIAKVKFRSNQRVVVDEEDVALDVLDSLFRNFARGNFESLRNRNDLWYLLLSMTQQRVLGQIHENNCKRRGEGRVFPVTDLGEDSLTAIENLVDATPPVEVLAAISELCDFLIARLSDPMAQEIVRLKLQYESHKSIADKLEVPVCVVDRKMKLIRKKWSQAFSPKTQASSDQDTVEGE